MGDYALLIGGEGDDSILCSGSGLDQTSYHTIFAGDGNDTILNFGEHSIIYGGEGNDLLDNEGGKYSTIVGGTGDDYIKLWYGGENGSVIEYTEGDGNDVVMFQGNEYYVSRIPDVNFSILKGSYTVERFAGVDSGLLIKVGNGSIRVYRVGTTININGVPVTAGNSTSSNTPTTPTSTTTPTVTNNIGGTTNIYNGPVYINNTTINNTEINNTTNTTINETNINYITSVNNTYIYNGGDKIINNYVEGQAVQLTSDYQGIDVKGDTFIVKSSDGDLEIQNARDKFIGYSGADNNVVAYSYMASGAGDIDGRNYDKAEILIGADNANNKIYAGNGGSSLWGGNGGNDTLTGGDGYDEFFYANGSGGDVIKNASSDDVVNLLGVTLNQIIGYSYDSSSVSLQFNDGGSLRVEGNSGTGYRLENQTYVCNKSTGEWTTK